MSTKTFSKLFDLTAAIELQQSLSLRPIHGEHDISSQDFACGKDPPPKNTKENTSPAHLGDFSKLFQVLGMSPLTDVDPTIYRLKVDYASDGVVNDKTISPGKKSVQWHDNVTDPEGTDTAPDCPSSSSVQGCLTKKQAKKERAKLNHQNKTALVRERLVRRYSVQAGTVSETEVDPVRRLLTPAGKAAAHSQEGHLCDSPTALDRALKRMDEKRAEIGSERPRTNQEIGDKGPRTYQQPSPSRGWKVMPLLARSDAERELALLLKLIHGFPEDHAWISAKTTLAASPLNPGGAHIFIDASNIFIGFEDALKAARGIPLSVRIPNVDLSFEAFALLLERKRPVAKRVLVGSNPRLPAHDKAEELGYECHLLEKVYKVKPLSEKQKFFATRHGTPVTVEKPRFHEQGVDELLHLKMLESLLDHSDGAQQQQQQGTMVLATGDGAEAEYSDGFLGYVRKALARGWTVELVSWKSNINRSWIRLTRQTEYRDTFRIIYLDDFAEELLRTQG